MGRARGSILSGLAHRFLIRPADTLIPTDKSDPWNHEAETGSPALAVSRIAPFLRLAIADRNAWHIAIAQHAVERTCGNPAPCGSHSWRPGVAIVIDAIASLSGSPVVLRLELLAGME